jgi:hypothetical protein
LPAPPRTLRSNMRWGCNTGGARQLSRGRGRGWGRGHRFRGAAAAAIVLGVIASVTAGWMLGVTDQDLRQSEAWLGNRRRLAGVIRAAVAGHCHRPNLAVVAGRSILLGHGVAPGGAWYNDRLLKGSVAVVVGGGCGCGGGVSRYYYLDKNDNFACHVTFAG